MKIWNITHFKNIGQNDVIYEVMPKGMGIKHFKFVCEHPFEKGSVILSRGYLRSNDLHVMTEQILKSNLHYMTIDQKEAIQKYREQLEHELKIHS